MNANYALVCLLARNAMDKNPTAIERSCRLLARLARSHLLVCERACNEAGDFDTEREEIEASIRNVASLYGCVARFETDPRGITVFIVGSNGTAVDA